jgi:Protein of unknown function (DUF3618)
MSKRSGKGRGDDHQRTGRKARGAARRRPRNVSGHRRASGRYARSRRAANRPAADADTGPPDDVHELQQEIEQTREQLGETVEQLVARTDVKARARAKADELTGRVRGKTSQARTRAVARAGKMRDQLASKTGGTGQRAMSWGTAASQRLSGRLVAAGTPVRKATPEPIRQALAKGASSARQRRAPLAVVAGVLTFGYLVIRWWRRR